MESKLVLDVINYKLKLYEFRNVFIDVDFEILFLIKMIVKGRKFGFEFGEFEVLLRKIYLFFLFVDDLY